MRRYLRFLFATLLALTAVVAAYFGGYRSGHQSGYDKGYATARDKFGKPTFFTHVVPHTPGQSSGPTAPAANSP